MKDPVLKPLSIVNPLEARCEVSLEGVAVLRPWWSLVSGTSLPSDTCANSTIMLNWFALLGKSSQTSNTRQ